MMVKVDKIKPHKYVITPYNNKEAKSFTTLKFPNIMTVKLQNGIGRNIINYIDAEIYTVKSLDEYYSSIPFIDYNIFRNKNFGRVDIILESDWAVVTHNNEPLFLNANVKILDNKYIIYLKNKVNIYTIKISKDLVQANKDIKLNITSFDTLHIGYLDNDHYEEFYIDLYSKNIDFDDSDKLFKNLKYPETSAKILNRFYLKTI